MPFKPKIETEKLKHQIMTTLNGGTHEMWVHLCRKHQKSSHHLLREIVEKFCREEMQTGLPVLEALKGRSL